MGSIGNTARLIALAKQIRNGLDLMVEAVADDRLRPQVDHAEFDLSVAHAVPQEITLRGSFLKVQFEFDGGPRPWDGAVLLYVNSVDSRPLSLPLAQGQHDCSLSDFYFDRLFVANPAPVAGCTLHLWAGWGAEFTTTGRYWYDRHDLTIPAGASVSPTVEIAPNIDRALLFSHHMGGSDTWIEASPPDNPGAFYVGYEFCWGVWYFGLGLGGVNAPVPPPDAYVTRPAILNSAVDAGIDPVTMLQCYNLYSHYEDVTRWVAPLVNCNVRLRTNIVVPGNTPFFLHVRGVYY